MTRKKVHVTNSDGKLLYTRLWDDGSLVLMFDTPGGFIDRLDVWRYRWVVCPGWKETGNA